MGLLRRIKSAIFSIPKAMIKAIHVNIMHFWQRQEKTSLAPVWAHKSKILIQIQRLII